MPQTASDLTVVDRNPRVGETLLFDNRHWEITDHSTYKNDEGFSVDEWCCEISNAEAYLLKEREDGKILWFFTRWHPNNSVTIEGDSLRAWIKRHPLRMHGDAGASVEGSKPPERIVFKGQPYVWAEEVAGDYEEDPGDSETKITWEYWDPAHKQNVALEFWQNGEIDVYQGAYVDPTRLWIKAEARGMPNDLRAAWVDPLLAVPVLIAGLFFIGLLIGKPFDQTMSVVLPAAFAGAAYIAASRFVALGLAAAVLSLLGFAIYRIYPPLTTPIGIAASLVLPALLSLFARRRYDIDPPAVPRFLAGFTTGFPALVQGLITYVKYAPSPRTFGEWTASWGSAAVVGTAGYLIAVWLARPKKQNDPDVPALIS